MELRFARGDDNAIRLATLYQRAPLRVLLPAQEEIGSVGVVLLNTAGGLVGGDRLDIDIEAGAGATVLITGQAAEKAYRSAGPTAEVNTRLTAGRASCLEWLPQGLILFDGARLRRNTTIDLGRGAQVLAGEIVIFGRRSRGERFTRGMFHDAWRVHRDGRLVWADAFRLDEAIASAFTSSACLDGAAAIATILLADDDSHGALDLVRQTGDAECGNGDGRAFAATQIGPLVIARALDRDAARLRLGFGRIWAILRGRCGLAPRLPRVWSI